MTLRGHFDGKVVVLDEPPPRDWRPDMEVSVVAAPANPSSDNSTPDQEGYENSNETLLQIAEMALPGLPPDFSEQHDHYIHGTPKK